MRLLIGLLFASCAFGQAHEILRPTVDSNSTNTAIGCSGTNQTSLSMPNSWDAAGLATNSSNSASGSQSVTNYKVRLFTTWAAPTQSYTALSLKVNSAGTETNNTGSSGTINVMYSLNAGSTWSVIRAGGGNGSGNWTQTTDSIVLSTSQDFTKLQVAVCVQGTAGGDTQGTRDQITVWDIWTDGTYAGAAAGSGSSQGVPAIQPILISEFVDRRRYGLSKIRS